MPLESSINPDLGMLAYSTYPSFGDIDMLTAFEQKCTTVDLFIYELATKKQTKVASSKAKNFEPEWISQKTLQYNNPDGSGRIEYKVTDGDTLALIAGENAVLRKLERCNVSMLQPKKSYPGEPIYRKYADYDYEFYEIADFAGRSWKFNKNVEPNTVWGTDITLTQQGSIRLLHSDEVMARYPGTDTIGADYVSVQCAPNKLNQTSKQVINTINNGRLSELNKYSPTYTYEMSEVIKTQERLSKWNVTNVFYQVWENPNVSYVTKEYVFAKDGFIYIVTLGDNLAAVEDANLDATKEAQQTTHDILDSLEFGSLTKTYQTEVPAID